MAIIMIKIGKKYKVSGREIRISIIAEKKQLYIYFEKSVKIGFIEDVEIIKKFKKNFLYLILLNQKK